MTCTKTENGLLFSKDGKEVLVEDVSHPHFAKHVAVSFTLADIETNVRELFHALLDYAFANDDMETYHDVIESVGLLVDLETADEDKRRLEKLTRHVDDRYEDDGA